MVQSLQFFRRIMLLLNVTVGAFLVWVFGMTPVLAARQSDGVAFAQMNCCKINIIIFFLFLSVM